MQSPFKIFRKHQRVVLAALTLMAMIGFGLGDTLLKMVRIGGSQQGTKNVVETNVGSLSQIAMNNLAMHRRVLYRFIETAYQKSHPEFAKSPFFRQIMPMVLNEYGFGGVSPDELLFAWLHRHEARKMGIVVSDKQIEDYIDRFTDRKLSTKKFREILDDMRLSPKELFDMFRDELQADIARKMKLPAQLPSPEKYWEYYQQLNTQEKIEIAALPVKDFTDKVPDPKDSEVAALFEKHKTEFESAFGGEFKPGFRQPRKVKLHYLVLSSTAVEDKVLAQGAVSEKEIVEYYDRKKDIDNRMHEVVAPPPDDSAPIDPEFAPENETKPPGLNGDASEKPEDDPKKSEDKKSQDKESEYKSDCLASNADDEAAADEAADDAEGAKKDEPARPAAAKKSQAADDDDEKADPKADADKEPAKKDKVGDDASEDDEDVSEIRGKKRKRAAPTIKYKPLDDDLRELIRDLVIHERRQKLMKEQTAKAIEALREVGLRFSTSTEIKLTDPNPEQLKTIEQRSEDELKKIARELDLRFEKTDLVSPLELSEIPGLGKAMEPGTNDSLRSEVTSIVDLAFGSEALCRVFEAETSEPNANSYICWKVQDAAAHVPRLEEPGIRDQVVKAWKRVEALPLAKTRAEELAERLRKEDKDFAAALGAETVTGDKRGLSITVSESKEFSFYRDSSAPDMFRQNQGPRVQLGNPIPVHRVGQKFMHVVFDELAEGEIGVALNDDASVYYVVKVLSRRPADRDAFKEAALFAYPSPYAQVAQIDWIAARDEYYFRMRDKYAVKWNDLPAHEMGPMGDDE